MILTPSMWRYLRSKGLRERVQGRFSSTFLTHFREEDDSKVRIQGLQAENQRNQHFHCSRQCKQLIPVPSGNGKEFVYGLLVPLLPSA